MDSRELRSVVKVCHTCASEREGADGVIEKCDTQPAGLSGHSPSCLSESLICAYSSIG